MLEEKMAACQACDIEFIVEGDFSNGQFINLVDMSIIFGNIIDNAIEACERIKIKETRKIYLSISEYEQFLVIRTTNPITEKIIQKGEKLLTTKMNKNLHGLGLLSVDTVLKSYGGWYSYKVEDDIFIFTAFIPVSAKCPIIMTDFPSTDYDN